MKIIIAEKKLVRITGTFETPYGIKIQKEKALRILITPF